MPHFQTIEARPHHCGQIVRRLRLTAQCAFLKIGLDPHHELRDCFDASYLRRAWIVDGRVEGVGGVYGGALSSTGYIWLALSQQATRYPVALVKEARRQMSEIEATKYQLEATIFERDQPAERFALRMGFHLSNHIRDGVYMWTWRRGIRMVA